jgi:hypothetical protein
MAQRLCAQQEEGRIMKRIMLATVAGAALLAGVGAASAQTFQSDGPDYYANRGPFVERGVGLQIGPVGVGAYDNGPVYGGAYTYNNRAPRPRDNSVYESNSFRAQEFWPQSPPGGGY